MARVALLLLVVNIYLHIWCDHIRDGSCWRLYDGRGNALGSVAIEMLCVAVDDELGGGLVVDTVESVTRVIVHNWRVTVTA